MNESMEDISLEIQDLSKQQSSFINYPYFSVTNSSFISQGIKSNNQKKKKSPVLQDQVYLHKNSKTSTKNQESPLTQKASRIQGLYQKLYETVQNKQFNNSNKKEHAPLFPQEHSHQEQMQEENKLFLTGTFAFQQALESSSVLHLNESAQVKQIMDLIDQLEQTLGNPISQNQSQNTSLVFSNSPSFDFQKEEMTEHKKQIFKYLKDNLINLETYVQKLNAKEQKLAKQEREIQKRLYHLLRKETKLKQVEEQEESILAEPLLQLFNRLEKAKEIFNKNLKEFNKDVQRLQKKEQKLHELQKQLMAKKNNQQQILQCQKCTKIKSQILNEQSIQKQKNEQHVYQHHNESFQQKDLQELNYLLDQSSILGNIHPQEQQNEIVNSKKNQNISLDQSNFQNTIKKIQQTQNLQELESIKQELIIQSQILQQREEELAKLSIIAPNAQSVNQISQNEASRQLFKCKSENGLQSNHMQWVQKESDLQKKKIELEEKSVKLLRQEAMLTIKEEQIQKRNDQLTGIQAQSLFSPQTARSFQSQIRLQSEASERGSLQTINEEYQQLAQLQEKIEIIANKQKQKEEMLNNKQEILKKAKIDLETAFAQLRSKNISIEKWKKIIQKQLSLPPNTQDQNITQENLSNQIQNINSLMEYMDDTQIEFKDKGIEWGLTYYHEINDIVSVQKRKLLQNQITKKFLNNIYQKANQKLVISQLFSCAQNQAEETNQKLIKKVAILEQKLSHIEKLFSLIKTSEKIKKKSKGTIQKKVVLEKLKNYKLIIQKSTNNLMQTLQNTKQINKQSCRQLSKRSRSQITSITQETNESPLIKYQQENLQISRTPEDFSQLSIMSSIEINKTQNDFKLLEKYDVCEAVNQSHQIYNQKDLETFKHFQEKLNSLESQLSFQVEDQELKDIEYINLNAQNSEYLRKKYSQLCKQKENLKVQKLELKELNASLFNYKEQLVQQKRALEEREFNLKQREKDNQDRELKISKKCKDLENEIQKYKKIEQETNIKRQKVQIQEEALQKRISELQIKSQYLDSEIIQQEKLKFQIQNQQQITQQKIKIPSSESILKQKNLEILEQQLTVQEKHLNKRQIQLSNKEQEYQQ